MRHSRHNITLAVALVAIAATVHAYEHTFTIKERLGHTWDSDLVHRTVDVVEAGALREDAVALFFGGREVPVQLDAVEKHADGSIRKADVWFHTDLPAGQTRTFVLRGVKSKLRLKKWALGVQRRGNVLELRNAHTAARVPAGEWSAPQGDAATVARALGKFLGVPTQDEDAPGPLLGVRRPSGEWTAASSIRPYEKLDEIFQYLQDLIQPVDPAGPAGRLLGYRSEVTARGPLFARVRVTYRFEGDGRYVVDVTLRAGEPLVRIDERYEKAGALVVDMAGFQPTKALYESFRASDAGMSLDLSYDKKTKDALFLGWDFYFKQIAAAFALTGDPSGDLIGLVSTHPDWLPFPYNQALHVVSAPGPKLTLTGNLWSGHRHWAIYLGKRTDFGEKTGKGFYRWWNTHLRLPLDKVSSWQLEWPGMDEIEFPHALFAAKEISTIRERLRAEPAVQEVMKRWQTRKGYVFHAAFPQAGQYLYSGDTKYLEQLKGKPGLFGFLDANLKHALTDCGLLSAGAGSQMDITDRLLTRFIAMELVLGSDLLTAEERHEILKKLAFLVYQMHDPVWIPPNYTFDPGNPPYHGYVQGTPNQKGCYYMTRAVAACMLKGHPKRPEWIDYALEENDRVATGSVHQSGALLESCFYTSRDTMRWGPMWRALEHAGCTDPRVAKWQAIQKRALAYLTDMLTPPDPRLGGRRAYHPLGRSTPGVHDPTFAIGSDPWGADDPAHRARMRWAWTAQGRPPLDIMHCTGGRDVTMNLISFAMYPAEPLAASPLRSKRWEGMGVVFRSQVDSGFESNVVFRHDPFCWDLYETNNGAIYFYGKGVPLLPRFGAYWNHRPNLMSIPFGNRLIFAKGDEHTKHFTNGLGEMVECALLGDQVDFAVGVTREKDWRRRVLLAKDANREDPIYLLVRDDTSRAGSGSALHWWVMSKQVQPGGCESQGVVPGKGYTDDEWMAKLGRNWPDAPELSGQLHRLEGQYGVDIDFFIASPREPKLVTDAVACGPRLAYCVNPKMIECQQLIRIEQGEGKDYLTLIVPRWPGSAPAEYQTIANGAGVLVRHGDRRDRLFLAESTVTYRDDNVAFRGRAGYARLGGAAPVRLMVVGGTVSAGGLTLKSDGYAALTYADHTATVYAAGAHPQVQPAPELQNVKVRIIRSGEPEGPE